MGSVSDNISRMSSWPTSLAGIAAAVPEEDEEYEVEMFMVSQDTSFKHHVEVAASEGSGDASSDCAAALLEHVLGPPLNILPNTISPKELAAYRADYQAFRSGKSRGARGEIGNLDAAFRQRNQAWGMLKPAPYEIGAVPKRHRSSLVPLIGMELASSSAARSAVAAAGEHHRARSSFSGGTRSEVLGGRVHYDDTLQEHHQRDSPKPKQPLELPLPGGLLSAESGNRDVLRPAVQTKQGMVLLCHVLISLLCLLPLWLLEEPTQWKMLLCPVSYVGVILVATLRVARGSIIDRRSPGISLTTALAKVLHMERLVRERYVPAYFVPFCVLTYGFVAWELVFARLYTASKSEGPWFSLFGNSVQRYDYGCVGSSTLDVADCVLVRHAASSTLTSFYTCLLVVCVCNRSVQGVEIVARHRDRLLELFPDEAEALFSYIEASITSNDASWRSNRRYLIQSMVFALGLAMLSFSVYMSLLDEAASWIASATFVAAVPFAYGFHFVMLRHVFLEVLLNLEGIKARAAALAYCDEEGVLPFDSGHAVYVWFSIRRNSHAENEIAYQRVTPVFAVFLACAFGCSLWLGAELLSKGLSIFALTSRGGSDLIIVAYALVSSFLVAVTLQTFLDIGKLEEAHLQQLRVARLRVEHARRYPHWTHTVTRLTDRLCEAVPPPHVEVDLDMPSPSNFVLRGQRTSTWPAPRDGREELPTLFPPPAGRQSLPPLSQHAESEAGQSSHHDMQEAQDLEGASELLALVLQLLEQHSQKPTIFGVEIGQKTFQVINAALTSHAFAVLVWGVLVPSLANPSEEGDVNLVGARTTT